MHVPQVRSLWLLFAAGVVAAWSFVTFGWMFSWYMKGQFAFLLLTVSLAAFLVLTSKKTAALFSAVAVGLLLANWGLLEVFSMVSIWSIGGFAP